MRRLLCIIILITFMAPFFSPLASAGEGRCRHSSEKQCNHKHCPTKEEAVKSVQTCHHADKKPEASKQAHCATHFECATENGEADSYIKIKEVPLTAFSDVLRAVFACGQIWPRAVSEYSDHIPEGPFKPPARV